MCQLYGVTRAGYYAWRKRPRSNRQRTDEQLIPKIVRVYQDSDQTYGSPRVYQSLKQSGETAGKRKIERLMRENGIQAVSTKLYRRLPGLHKYYTSIKSKAHKVKVTAIDQV